MTDEDLKLYRGLIKERDEEIARLREVVRKYGNRIRMNTAMDPALQQTIDDAFDAAPTGKFDITPV
ncbi:hypothetical protein IWQ55_004780 [Labrenzia sp. EL_208]|nr:hypothetical protein [Labrenzia sp. EL_132]MBG6231551.1 hypothetical protein [Labrenzia sp. EL_208]